jgi:hypothetical protein
VWILLLLLLLLLLRLVQVRIESEGVKKAEFLHRFGHLLQRILGSISVSSPSYMYLQYLLRLISAEICWKHEEDSPEGHLAEQRNEKKKIDRETATGSVVSEQDD